jgi:anaerobic selenocysteine-containing dehydrogenase
MDDIEGRRVVRTTCNRDCPDACGIVAEVEGGRIVSHRGDPEHGITRGFLCHRGRHYLDRFYSPDRITHPLRRDGDGWRRVSWDEALDEIAGRLVRCRDRDGAASVLVVSYSGITGLVAKQLGRIFWRHFGGVSLTEGGLSVEATHAAQHLDFGAPATHSPEDLANARGFAIWGKNVAVTRPHVLPFINAARKKGAPVHVVDPVRCSMAQRADRHHQLRPGTDAWLALGVGRVLVERGAYDRDFVEAHTVGFEAYERLVTSVDLDRVARITDVDRARIEELAELYAASTRPLATMIGLGPSYWRGAGVAVRLIDALAAVSGNLGVAGGGAHTDTEGQDGMDLSLPEGTPRVKNRRLLLPRLGQAILEASAPPIRVGWIAGANPAATAPDTGRVVEALRSLDFLVVVDQFMTASAAEAHIVLPCTTYLEMDDLITAYGHHWIGLCRQVVPPRGEARSDVAIYQALARRLGFGEALEGAPSTWIRRLLGSLAADGVTPEALAERPLRNPRCAAVPFADRRFATASGKVELVDAAGAMPEPPVLEEGELFLVATKTLRMVNAQINGSDVADEPVVRVNPRALAERRIGAGQVAWLVSPVGRVRVRIEGDEATRPDVALFNPAAWRGDLQGVNQLRVAALTDIGKGAAMHETRVRLEPAAAEASEPRGGDEVGR